MPIAFQLLLNLLDIHFCVSSSHTAVAAVSDFPTDSPYTDYSSCRLSTSLCRLYLSRSIDSISSASRYPVAINNSGRCNAPLYSVASSSSNILFDDLFKVSAVDRDGKKFDRVSRINAKSENHEMDLTLDVNTDLWPLAPNDTFSFVLANSLTTSDATADGINGVNEGDGETAAPSWRLVTGKSMGLADEYDYVMYGKVYKFDGAAAERVTAYASFGGLLMALTGAYRHVSNVTVGDNIYLLARK